MRLVQVLSKKLLLKQKALLAIPQEPDRAPESFIRVVGPGRNRSPLVEGSVGAFSVHKKRPAETPTVRTLAVLTTPGPSAPTGAKFPGDHRNNQITITS